MPNGQFGTDIGTALKRQVTGLAGFAEQQLQRQQTLEDFMAQEMIRAQIRAQFREPKQPSMADMIRQTLGVAGGIVPPEQIMAPEEIRAAAPLEVGRAERGAVMAPPGATFRERQIFGPAGRRIGEFAPGAEPRRAPEAIPAFLRQRLGVAEEEARRKFLGLPKAVKPKKPKRLITPKLKEIPTQKVFQPMGLFRGGGIFREEPVINEITMELINNIETQEDFEDFLADREFYEGQGIDTAAVMNHFMPEVRPGLTGLVEAISRGELLKE